MADTPKIVRVMVDVPRDLYERAVEGWLAPSLLLQRAIRDHHEAGEPRYIRLVKREARPMDYGPEDCDYDD